MQKNAAESYKDIFTTILQENDITSQVQLYIGPRRIAVHISDLPSILPPKEMEIRGPKITAPDSAITGFCRANNIERKKLSTSLVQGQLYYIINKKTAVMEVQSLLAQIILKAISKYTWPKSMRWGNYDISWVRPIRNILCIFDGKILPVKYGHLQANNITFGHRFINPEPLIINDFADYRAKLIKAHVVLSQIERMELIKKQLEFIGQSLNLIIKEDKKLLEEVTGLVEFPVVMLGKIPEKFLTLPTEVLVSSMKSHQKYFNTFDQSGNFAPYFLFVSNMPSDREMIIKGNEKVLAARLSDALYFYQQDLSSTLESRLAKLEQITFHAKIGTMRQKVVRIGDICRLISPENQSENQDLQIAVRFCKSDLTSEMVGEFPELQGIMGYYYAKAEGLSHEIASAIRDHYKPQGPLDEVPIGSAAIIAMADKLDNLIGLILAGEEPSGSRDPYSLRRQAIELKQAQTIGEFNEDAYKLAKIFWPGPLSIIVPLKSNAKIAKSVLAGMATVALRVPSNPIARELIKKSGAPIAAPSANPSGYISSTTFKHVQEHFLDKKEVFILPEDLSKSQYGIESTIIDTTSNNLTILRPGFITKETLEKVLDKKIETLRNSLPIKAPGMLLTHYSPKVKVRINAVSLQENEIGLNFADSNLNSSFSVNLSIIGDLIEAASNLYIKLRILDCYAIQNKISTIAVAKIPQTEELLISADMSYTVAAELVNKLKSVKFNADISPIIIKEKLVEIIATLLTKNSELLELQNEKLNVILVSGVNGSGKTTTIGKLATIYSAQGKKVAIVACDTFRAAAVSQLSIWAQRSNAIFIAGEEGADPASVAYLGMQSAIKNNIEILLIDTAGRLHNQKNLMDELEKIIRVIKKIDEAAPHHSILVIDATTGQNVYNQIEQFKSIANISGLIVTKLDGTAKAGVVVGATQKFALPIYFIGIGEKIDDLKPFDSLSFANSLVGIDLKGHKATPIYAAADGRIITVSRKGAYGNLIEIKHSGRFITKYAHLKKISVLEGEVVIRGQIIGLQGNTDLFRDSLSLRDFEDTEARTTTYLSTHADYQQK
ncbi:Glycine--tRNA ligase beta subunit [Pseudolycoriella hygida]|uniref:Threonylcarbamoyl-AMP synthase n=1 Tax=Pseudolycoriella hygida TaxID=35572 RepID=A0A9Q0N787_9DIPT|nr:Glycine--tRNA ligase beta subunit [Pseudolycoriella hygida]